ncbi:MAG: N-acetylmuramoyl-L-alanine amidase [Angelakisella sp.]
MPTIYLSPSTQEKNLYVNGGTEEYYMNRVADAMEPYLRSNGIRYQRNTPSMTAASSLRQSNAGNYDLHLALHSNAAPEARYGQVSGSDVYYANGSVRGKRAADIIAENLQTIYPNPLKVRALTTTALGEVTRTRAPSVLVELAYHDNLADAQWIKDNIQPLARNLVESLTRYFGIPFAEAQPARPGVVDTQSGSLNIRKTPDLRAPILATAPRGARLSILGEWQNWDVVQYNGTIGYAVADYIAG